MSMELALAVIFLRVATFTVNNVPHSVSRNYIWHCMKGRLIVTIILTQLWWIKEPIDNIQLWLIVYKTKISRRKGGWKFYAKGTQVGKCKKHAHRKQEHCLIRKISAIYFYLQYQWQNSRRSKYYSVIEQHRNFITFLLNIFAHLCQAIGYPLHLRTLPRVFLLWEGQSYPLNAFSAHAHLVRNNFAPETKSKVSPKKNSPGQTGSGGPVLSFNSCIYQQEAHANFRT